jgi:saccharopine dehydrogenase (NAD+, L-lysine-forming)
MALKLWLREETKAFERRTPLTPHHASLLVNAGVEITVEESVDRIFPLSDYVEVGCKTSVAHSWKEANLDQTILGLKEIELTHHTFHHDHIYFAHIFKGQAHATKVLRQYKEGSGRLFDLEFLTDKNKRRIAAFGHWAGFVGAALSLDRFLQQQIEVSDYPELKSFESIEEFLSPIGDKIKEVSKHPKVIIIGAKGRCGKGAHSVFERFNIPCTLWDYEETKPGGPFTQILEHDIFINTVLLSQKIAPFINKESLSPNQALRVIGDVSCDPESEFNPVPVYDRHTNWKEPFLKVEHSELEVLAVDNLPSILPRESSEDFSEQLYPHLLDLHKDQGLPEVFKNALQEFDQNISKV